MAIKETINEHETDISGGRTIRARFAFADGSFGLVSRRDDPFGWSLELPSGSRITGRANSVYDACRLMQDAIRQTAAVDITLVAGTIHWSNMDYATVFTRGYILRDRERNMLGSNGQLKGSSLEWVHAAIMARADMRNATHTPDDGEYIPEPGEEIAEAHAEARDMAAPE
jgi:hypothetical protein